MGATLGLVVAGQPASLRVLAIEEGEAWHALFAETVAALPVPLGSSDLVGSLLRVPITVVVDLVLAYDADRALGTRDRFTAGATRAEAWSALQAIIEAENPWLPAGRRAVEALYPLIASQLPTILAAVLAQALRRAAAPEGEPPDEPPAATPADPTAITQGGTPDA